MEEKKETRSDREEQKQDGKKNMGEETEPEEGKENTERKGAEQQWQQQNVEQKWQQQNVALAAAAAAGSG